MDFRPDLYPELYRDMVRERMERQRLGEPPRRMRLSASSLALRAQVARTLFRAAFALDSGEVWRGLWEQLTKNEAVGGKVGR
jgi:hypothetical protein